MLCINTFALHAEALISPKTAEFNFFPYDRGDFELGFGTSFNKIKIYSEFKLNIYKSPTNNFNLYSYIRGGYQYNKGYYSIGAGTNLGPVMLETIVESDGTVDIKLGLRFGDYKTKKLSPKIELKQ